MHEEGQSRRGQYSCDSIAFDRVSQQHQQKQALKPVWPTPPRVGPRNIMATCRVSVRAQANGRQAMLLRPAARPATLPPSPRLVGHPPGKRPTRNGLSCLGANALEQEAWQRRCARPRWPATSPSRRGLKANKGVPRLPTRIVGHTPESRSRATGPLRRRIGSTSCCSVTSR